MFKDLLRHAAWPTPTVAVALRSRPPPREGAKAPQRAKIDGKLTALLLAFMQELSVIRVLDPACGSGNFLYVSLLLLLDLWKEVWLYMEELGLQRPFALEGFCPSPLQLHGIELNEYAHELAQVTIWIGYIQWLRDNGFGTPSEPILKPIDTIVQMDAILAYDAEGKPVEPEWPAAEVVVGNPPFLGDKRMRSQLGDKYVDDLRNLYEGCVPGGADLVTYWFERAREMIVLGRVQRSGLLATQSIRMGGSRRVLDRVKESGDIFMAWSDRRWAVEGAAVRVSMVGFDDGSDQTRMLDGKAVTVINADLTAATDLTTAVQLTENRRLCFQGPVKVGPFEIDPLTAQTMLATSNPNGRSSSEVLAPWLNGQDITGRSRGLWIIDFGEMTIDDACLFEQPFEYVRSHVKPLRDSNNDAQRRKNW